MRGLMGNCTVTQCPLINFCLMKYYFFRNTDGIGMYFVVCQLLHLQPLTKNLGIELNWPFNLIELKRKCLYFLSKFTRMNFSKHFVEKRHVTWVRILKQRLSCHELLLKPVCFHFGTDGESRHGRRYIY